MTDGSDTYMSCMAPEVFKHVLAPGDGSSYMFYPCITDGSSSQSFKVIKVLSLKSFCKSTDCSIFLCIISST